MTAKELRLNADHFNGKIQDFALALNDIDIKDLIRCEVERMIAKYMLSLSEEGKYEYHILLKNEYLNIYKKEFKKRGFKFETLKFEGMEIYVPTKISWADDEEDDIPSGNI